MPAEFFRQLARQTQLLMNAPGPLEFIFDFDGTLSPIVPVPSLAKPDPSVAAVLARLVTQFHVSIVSGRPVEFLLAQLGFLRGVPGEKNIGLYGIYGIEHAAMNGERFEPFPLDPREMELLEMLRQKWLLSPLPDVLFEDKGTSIAFHFRSAPRQREALADWINDELPDAGLVAKAGKMVFEILPASAPNKAGVVGSIATLGTRAVFAGDDYGDLDVFRLFRAQRSQGATRVGILVQGGFETPPDLLNECDIAVRDQAGLAFVVDRMARALTGPRAQGRP